MNYFGIFISLIVGLSTSSFINNECALLLSGNIYDLGPLNNKSKDYSVQLSDQQTLYFSFCRPAIHQCTTSQDVKTQALMVLSTSGDETICTALTGDYLDSLSDKGDLDTAELFTVSLSKDSTGISIQFLKPSNSDYSITLDLECNAKQDLPKFEISSFEADSKRIKILGTAKESCPVYQGHYFLQKILAFKYTYILLAFFLGVIECFYGFKLVKPTLFLMGFLSGFFGCGIFLLSITTGTSNDQTTRFWSILVFSLLVGITGGFLLPSLTRIGLAISGGVLGFFLGVFIHNIFFIKIKSNPPKLFFYNLLTWASATGFIFGFEFHDHILILASGIIGAEQFIRSIGMIVGGYPNELDMIDKMNQGQDIEFKWSYVVYGALIVIISSLGIWNQYRLKKMKDERDRGADFLKALIQASDKDEDD